MADWGGSFRAPLCVKTWYLTHYTTVLYTTLGGFKTFAVICMTSVALTNDSEVPLYSTTVYLLKIWQDKNNSCCVLPKQIEIKLQISHRNASVPNN